MKDSFMAPARAPAGILLGTEQVSSGSNLAMILSALLIAVTLMGIMAFCVWMCGCGADDVIRGRSGSRSNKSSSTGMSSEEIEKLIPKMSYSVVSVQKKNADVGCCSVCLCEFTKEDQCIRVLPKCGHCFHTDCISMWLFSHTSCPVCRAVLATNNSQRSCSNCQRVANSSSSSSSQTVHRNPDEVVIDVDERDTSASTSDR